MWSQGVVCCGHPKSLGRRMSGVASTGSATPALENVSSWTVRQLLGNVSIGFLLIHAQPRRYALGGTILKMGVGSLSPMCQHGPSPEWKQYGKTQKCQYLFCEKIRISCVRIYVCIYDFLSQYICLSLSVHMCIYFFLSVSSDSTIKLLQLQLLWLQPLSSTKLKALNRWASKPLSRQALERLRP